ncbi:MAG: hypothetical protein JW742_07370 [Candidatus Aminicenantes bacterium]|nr:hypothetical protein [Candidatus Aminicenantes bacterium]
MKPATAPPCQRTRTRTLASRPAALGLALLALAAGLAAAPVDGPDATLVQAATGFKIQTPPRVFIDAPGADVAALQKGIAFVEWVAAAADAQIVVTLASAPGPAGTTVETLAFRGQKEFLGDDETIRVPPPPLPMTEDRSAVLNRTLKLGLMRYVGKTPVAKRVDISLLDKVKPTAVADPWNFWVFSLSADGFFMGEETYTSRSLSASLAANRTTPDWKIRLGLGGSSSKSVYKFEGQEIESASESRSFQGTVVRSLNDHWSVGGFLQVYSSTYSNHDVYVRVAPAVEFDLFPYAECTKRQLRFLYTVGFDLVRYDEETIFDKTRENLLSQELEVALELNRGWGTMSVSLEGSHYLHDFGKNRLELDGELSVRLFKGLSVNLDGGGSRIRDQLNLAKGGASFEEVILRRKQLATDYDYYFSVGLSLTFGSVRSNVVNPRFGSGGTSVSISTGG